jgi:indolepyruvate ferredoxin oxidoreductase
VGGTGVLTIGAVLATAVQIEGGCAKLLDMTGMAQKGGAVVSHLRIAETIDTIPSARIGVGQAALIIACDLVTATAPDVLRAAGQQTHLVANADVAPTAEFQSDNAIDLSAARFLASMRRRIAPDRTDSLPATSLAERLLGDAIFTNFMMVGFAAQKGLLPISITAIEEAIGLNGVSVKANLAALRIGRLAAADRPALLRLAGDDLDRPAKPANLDALVAERAAFLTAYQDEAYAARFRNQVRIWQEALGARDVRSGAPFLYAAADQLSRLMAYKDEYEVARLFVQPQFGTALAEAFTGVTEISLNLAPPLLPLGRDPRTGRPRKIRLSGRWVLPLAKVLARGKCLRGTRLDPFGYTRERQTERAVIGQFVAQMDEAVALVTQDTLQLATLVAEAAAQVRGFGPVKQANIARWEQLSAERLSSLKSATLPSSIPAARAPQPIATAN